MAHASSVRRVINQRPDSGGPHTETRRGAAAAHAVTEKSQAPRNAPLKDTTQAGGMLGLVPRADDGNPAVNVHELVGFILMGQYKYRGRAYNDLFSDQFLYVSYGYVSLLCSPQRYLRA